MEYFILFEIIICNNWFYCIQGCFLDTKECYDKPRCIEKTADRKGKMLFCCCDGDMCNQNFTWDPQPTEPPPHKDHGKYII